MQTKDVPRGLMLHAAMVADMAFRDWAWRGACPPAWYADPRLDHVPSKLFWHVAERLSHEGLLDFGVSLNRPWLTDKGLAALMGYR
jgi:hypothetical protein